MNKKLQNINIEDIDGKTLCVVYCQLHDPNDPDKGFDLSPLYGRAKVDKNTLMLERINESTVTIPISAYKNIFANDGTELLKGCEYFVMVKVGYLK